MKKILTITTLLLLSYFGIAQSPDNEKQAAQLLVQQNAQSLGLSQNDIQNSVVRESYIIPSSNIRMVYLQQTYQGIPVYNRMHVLAFKDGLLASNAGDRFISPDVKSRNASASPNISAANAVQASLTALQVKNAAGINVPFVPVLNGKARFGTMNFSLEGVTAELMWYPVEQTGELKLVWQVFMAPKTDEDYWLARIDATNGIFIDKQSLTIKCNWDGENHSSKQHQQHLNKSENAGNHLFNKNNFQTTGNGPAVVTSASYRVIQQPAESPIHPGGAPALVTDPWTKSPGNATTLGWHYDGTTYYPSTRGNNVHAYEDRAGTNVIGITEVSTTAEPTLTFDFVPNFTLEPIVRTPSPNQQFNTTNLFYWNNLIHDLSYVYGFTETARNFQGNNQGRGGAGNDYVLAEAQDGGGTNNANFSTPADGGKGRMQMYLWTAPTPDRDGDVDNGIIVHEYTHGISNRFTGNGSTCLTNAEQMGEGWSDYFGLMMTHDWSTALAGDGFTKPRGIGTYALNQPLTGLGIRQYRYCTDMAVNPLTYANLASVAVPHGVGTIWCTALWDMTWEIIQLQAINPDIFNFAGGGGNVIALKLVTEGMRLQPCSPGFIDGRNAILKADTLFYSAQYSCAIIKAFARRAMGIGAAQGSSNSRTDQTLSYVDCSSATCNAPTGLASSAITSTSATVSWTAVSGANNYDVDYKANASSTWINAATATTATSVNLSGLAAGVLHDWRVRANCTSGTSSYVQAQFTTATPPGGCPGIYDVSTNGTTAGAATIPFNTDINGLINPSKDNDYYRFVITTGGTITLSLTTLPANYQLALLNSSGSTLQSSTNSGTADETINSTVTAGTYYARVYPRNNGAWNATNCYTLRVQLGTASLVETTPEFTQSGMLKIYPNPVNDYLNVSVFGITNKQSSITIIDAIGTILRTISMTNNVQLVYVADLPKGVYLIKVKNGSSNLSLKFVKQ